MATAGGERGPGPERAYAATLPARGSVTLDPDESAHLVRSRRARAGDAVVLFDGRGTTLVGRLERADPRAAVVALAGPYPARRPARRVRLAVSLPEAGRADRLVAALAELGVADFAPLVAAHTARRRAEVAPGRARRWERLAREAAKVNGAAALLALHGPRTLARALTEPAVLLDPDPGAPALGAVFDEETAPWILVGPEGGFTADELAAAREAGAPAARVGNLALRTETAAIAAAACLLSG